MIEKNIIYLSYGNEREYNRTVFSIMSFFSWCNIDLAGVRITIYTDKPSYFDTYLAEFDVEYFFLTKELLATMLNGTGFIHRIKVAVIDLTFKKFPQQHVIFLDSDTFFLRNPFRLINDFSTNKSFMHLREYKLVEAVQRFGVFNQAEYPLAFNNYIEKHEFLILDRIERFTLQDYSWNSGVLGLNSSFSKYMNSVLRLTDEFYANSQWFISEQLAFSLVLQKTTEVRPCDDLIVHYWGLRQKRLMDGLIAAFLSNHSAKDLLKKKSIKKQTKKWLKMIEVDIILDQALISISTASYYHGLKQVIKLGLKNPLHLWTLFKEMQDKD